MVRRFRVVIFIAVMCLGATSLAAQQATDSGEGALNIFFDCPSSSGCRDMDFFRREVPVVNWVRDREVSDVHVLITSQATGGGGSLYTLAFIGRGAFLGQDQELSVGSSADATSDEQRQVISSRLKIGLVRYLAGTAAAERIVVSMGRQPGAEGASAPPGRNAPSSAQDDPWDFWAFRVGGNAFLNGESSFSSSNYSGNVSANRTTEAWKLNISGRYNRSESEFIISDDVDPVVSLIEDWSATSLLVKSLNPQWSVGATVEAGRSTRLNEDLRWNISPGVEYNFVPYSESSRRAFTIQGLLNVRHFDYAEETVYLETSETRVAGSVTAAVNQIQPWGRTRLSVTGSQYLHDSELYQVSMNGSVSVRLFKGFSVNVTGFYAWVRDQLYLEAGSASAEDILLRQRQLRTSFNYFTVIGFSYQFGSIFNNIVNPRFGGGSGGGEMMFFN